MSEDHWDNAGAYERFMGRWSRLLASPFLAWLAVPDRSHWLEIGCGTGALTTAICEAARPLSIVAVDTAPEFVTYCSEQLPYPDLQVARASTEALPTREGGYDAVVSSLVLNFLTDPVAALRNMRLACSAHGHVAALVWDYSEGMQFLRLFWDSVLATDPDAAPYDEAVRFPLCRPDALRSAFHSSGLRAVEVTAFTIPTVFPTFEDYWLSLSLGTGPAPSYVATLSEAGRQALLSQLRARIHHQAGEPLRLTARAWAVKGVRGGA